ncbi:hypothetical protein BASA81_012421 [Batrachochytrium salamandrivorans]|nr:hypothetical protein BASA81_012421 [Batrachochytrium salamandrivorans]
MDELKPATVLFSTASALVLLASIARRNVNRAPPASTRRTMLPAHCVLDPTKPPAAASTVPTAVKEPEESHDEILFFSQIGKSQAWLVGGKGANLGELTQAGFPVPGGYCITKVAFDLYMHGQGASGRSKFDRIESSAELTASQARQLVSEGELLESTCRQICDAYNKLCEQEGEANLMVAVRSSATAEDSSDASFAGQLETFLGVRGQDEVVQAVKACWASLYSDRVDSYRKMAGKGRGTKESSISVCVVVQRMLDADCAGVMFTANPFTQALDETVITGNWGLGESVVADIATPDTWILKEVQGGKFQVESTQLAKKLKKVVLVKSKHAGAEGCSEIVDITSPQEQMEACLKLTQLEQLAQLGKKVQQHYGNQPHDTEWGVKQGKLFLLQARPITTLSDEPPRQIDEFDKPCRSGDFITTCNAAEMFPGPMTPLTMSMFGRMADWSVQSMQIEFGCRDAIDLNNGVTGNYQGNFFLNMTNTLAPMCAGMIGGSMAKENGEMSILGRLNADETMTTLLSTVGGSRWFFVRLRNLGKYLKTMLFAPKRIPVMRERIRQTEQRFIKLFLGNPTAARIWHEMDSMMDEYDTQWSDGIVTSASSAATMLFAMKLLTPWGGDLWAAQPVAEFATLLGGGEETAESTGPVEAIARIRDGVVRNGTGAAEFAAASAEDGLTWIYSQPEWKREFELLLEQHGHRCVREAEMREKDWLEDPKPLIKMLQSSVRAALARTDSAANTSPASTVATLAGERIIASKKHLNFITRPLLRFFVKITRKNVHLRELGKSLQVKHNSEFKHAYRKLGERLALEGRLPEPDLLYFLTHTEVGILSCVELEHADVHRMKTRAAQRRRLLARQAQLRFPELTKGKPQPMVVEIGQEGENGQVLQGTAVSSGLARGKARICRTLDEASELQEGEILITPQTDVGWTPYFSIAGGLCTEIGGMLSHGAVVAREYSLPCVVGVALACDVIKTGSLVELDGDRGVLRIVQI